MQAYTVRILAFGLVFSYPTIMSQFVVNRDFTSRPFIRRGWKEDSSRDQDFSMGSGLGGGAGEQWQNNIQRLKLEGQISRQNSSYVILAPTLARPSSVYGVVVGVLKGDVPVEVRASLVAEDSRELGQAIDEVHPGNLKMLKMKIPKDSGSAEGGGRNALLRVEGRVGVRTVFANTTHVSLTPRFLTILVQMSRPIYNGGQRVEFRIIFLSLDLRPYLGPVDVYILDTDGYVLRRWLSRFPDVGVVQLGTLIPGLPKPGWWQVKVVARGQVETHPFRVIKYVVPRFEVHVEMPFYSVAREGNSLEGRFKGIFLTYMPVAGNATLTIYRKQPWAAPDSSFIKLAKHIYPYVYGWTNFSFPLATLLGNASIDLNQTEFKVQVAVQHSFLGDTFTGYARTRILSEELKLRFAGGGDTFNFKPGMVFSGSVAVSYSDGEPLSPERLKLSRLTVSATATLHSGNIVDLTKVEVESLIEVPQQDPKQKDWLWYNVTEDVTSQILEAFIHYNSFARYYQDGILRFTLDVPEGTRTLDVVATFWDSEGSAFARMKGVASVTPKDHVLHVTTSTETAVVGEFAVFHVRTSFWMDKFHYLVLAKGLLIYAATEGVTWKGTSGVSTFSVAVAKDMAPRFTLIVLHITSDGKLLTDAVHVAVSFENFMKVKMFLNQHKDHSMRTVEVATWAKPGSNLFFTCARLPTFQKQLSNRLTLTRLTKATLTLEPHPRSVHVIRHRSRYGYWTEKLTALSAENEGGWPLTTLHLAGLALATDASISLPRGTGSCNGELGFLECGDGSCYRQEEVCDGVLHCVNSADEHNCLTVNQQQQTANEPVKMTPELLEENYRLMQRSMWRDLFDKKEGGWCHLEIPIGPEEYEGVQLSLPPSPGKWVVDGFATHPDLGFVVMPEQEYDTTPTLLLRLEAPTLCRRGEQISIRVHVYNTAHKKVAVLVVLSGSPHYRFVNVEKDATVSHYNPRLSAGDHQHLLMIGGEEFAEVMMPLAVLKQTGTFSVTIKALSQLGRAQQTTKVKVQPEGVTVKKHTSVLLDLKSRATLYEFFDLPLDQSPEISKSIQRRYIYGSTRARVTLSGDVFGPLDRKKMLSFGKAFNGRILKSSDGLAFNFGTTVWTLHYLRLTNQLNLPSAKSAFDFLNVQLAGLLTRYKEGAFKMWHFSKPSVWVTTWALNVLLAAQLQDWENYIYIEPRLVRNAVSFILDHQLPDGSFKETHHCNVTLDHKMSSQWSSSEGEVPMVAFTALVTSVLHEAAPTLDGEVHTQANSATLEAVKFLERSLSELWDPYEIAITTYALTLVGSTEREVAVEMLEAQTRFAEGKTYWSRMPIKSNQRRRENSQKAFLLPKGPHEWDSSAVEGTSYALLVFLIREGVTPRTESIVKWLSSVRGFDHAFISSVDTVVALRALAEYSYRARLRDVTNIKMQMEITSTPGIIHNIVVNNRSLSTIHSYKLKRPWGHVNLMAQGSGQALGQVEIAWGVDLDRFVKKPPRKYFELTVTEKYPHFRNKTIITTTVCTRWIATDVTRHSHAAMLEVDVATGYWLYQPHANGIVRRAQSGFPQIIDAKSVELRIYWQFHYIPSELQCFSFDVRRRHPAANHTAVRSAKIYELLATEHFQSTIINATSLTALDICEACGSYQCPYCPTYSVAAVTLPITVLAFILPLLLFPFTRI